MLTCSICLDELQHDATALECACVFHTKCIQTWLKLRSECPNCGFVSKFVVQPTIVQHNVVPSNNLNAWANNPWPEPGVFYSKGGTHGYIQPVVGQHKRPKMSLFKRLAMIFKK